MMPAPRGPLGFRDPFDPVLTVDIDVGYHRTDGTPTTDTTSRKRRPATTMPRTDDGLPNTGSDPTNWLAYAYVLVAVGTGVLTMARVIRPAQTGAL